MSDNGDVAEQIAKWLTPIKAYSTLASVVESEIAQRAITERLRNGMLRSGAMQVSKKQSGYSARIGPAALIPSEHWSHVSSTDDWKAFWNLGDIRFAYSANARDRTSAQTLWYVDVRLEPTEINALHERLMQKRRETQERLQAWAQSSPPKSGEKSPALPPPPASPNAIEALAPNNRGRHRKEFWDDLLIEIFEQIWLGKLTPTCQADIERTMLQWASDHNHKLGETSVKVPAKKLYAAFLKEVKN